MPHSDRFPRLQPEQAINIDGLAMYIDAQDSLGLGAHGVFEATETALLQQLLQSGDTLLDIGANIGYYTLLAARAVGEQGHVYAFEPEPQNFHYLSHNVALNGFQQRVSLQALAASDSNAQQALYLCAENQGMHRAYPSVLCQQAIDIQSVRLDDYFTEIPNIDFIKMDIEGYEYRALLGMTRCIQQQAQLTLLTEFSPASMTEVALQVPNAKGDNDALAFLDLLSHLGFKVYSIEDIDTPLNMAELKAQVHIIKNQVEALLQPIQQNRSQYSLQDIIINLTEQCRQQGYQRPLFENFLCVKE